MVLNCVCDLMIGGPRHGEIVINGNHPDNENEEDLIYNLKDLCGREPESITKIHNEVTKFVLNMKN